jgi:hypothetical protein
MSKSRRIAVVASVIALAGGAALSVIPSASAFEPGDCDKYVSQRQDALTRQQQISEFSPKTESLKMKLTNAKNYQARSNQAKANIEKANGQLLEVRDARSRGQLVRQISGLRETSMLAAELLLQQTLKDEWNTYSTNLRACEQGMQLDPV